MINFIKKILGITDLEYQLRLIQRKNYWRDKYKKLKKQKQK